MVDHGHGSLMPTGKMLADMLLQLHTAAASPSDSLGLGLQIHELWDVHANLP